MVRWKYKNLTFLAFSIVIGFALSQNQTFHDSVLAFGYLGYISIFLAGMLFSSTFTVAIGLVMLIILSDKYSSMTIALIAGLGGLSADIIIFRFVRDGLVDEMKPIYKKLGGSHLTHLIHTKYFHWTLPVIGALIIASPLPDELGVTLMGISKMNSLRFMLISYGMNVMGMFSVIFAYTSFTR